MTVSRHLSRQYRDSIATTITDKYLPEDVLKAMLIDIIIKTGEKAGRFVKWALNQEFNAKSTRNQYEETQEKS